MSASEAIRHLGHWCACATLLALAQGAASAADLAGVTLTVKPFQLTTDVGGSVKEENAEAARLMPRILESANFLLQIYHLTTHCFDDYADFYEGPDRHYEKLIRIRVWRSFDDFCADFQKRYHTKAIPGAFFAIGRELDGEGQVTDNRIREIGATSEGNNEEALLRDLYHELGHLFMRTYMVLPTEVPSWIEEGTAQVIEFRIGNGTHPEGERDQREGWLREMVEDKSTIPWQDMINVSNLDNLDFTYQNPARSLVQYVQSWSMMEFMVGSADRQAAFLKMIGRFKQAAADVGNEVSKDYLYSIQEKTFEKSYGAKLLDVENVWKKYIKTSYERDLKTKPVLHYYRGDWYMTRADLAQKGEDPKAMRAKAAAIFQDCVKEQPKSPYGYVGLGRVAISEEKFDEAGADFDHALALGAHTYDALLYGGIARVLSGKGATAVAALTEAVSQRTTDAQAQLFLGQALALQGKDYAGAIAHLRLARDLDPKIAPDCSFIEGAIDYMTAKRHDALLAWMRTENLRADFDGIQLFEALAKADDSRDDAIALLKPIAETDQGREFAAILADPNLPLPTLELTATGWPRLVVPEPPKPKQQRHGDAPPSEGRTGEQQQDPAPQPSPEQQAKSLFGNP